MPTKDELLAEAEEKGVEATATMTKAEIEEALDAGTPEPAESAPENPFETWLVEAEAQLRSSAGAYPDAVQPGLLNAADGLKTALSAVRNFRSLQREPEDPNA